VHAGWRGTVSKIANEAVLAMGREYNSAPEDIRVAIGAHIGKCCYEVSDDVADALGQEGRYVSLSASVKRDLLAIGVKDEHIYVSPICTCCESDKFWSHRAVSGGERGVCLAVIMLKEERI
jgi:copper oxidase (laccase) domain-containing protein